MSHRIKAAILCGGQGSRIRDVSESMPKPMLSIGGKPILWHIMKLYAHFGINDFVLALGYKGWLIKEFFLNYYAKTSDLTVTLGRQDETVYHNNSDEADWTVTLAETGESALTGARVYRMKQYLTDCDYFCLTYGDGVANLNIQKLIEQHIESGLMATICGVHPSGRFGEIELNEQVITEFNEKPNVSTGLINGGFMVFKREALDIYFDENKNYNLEKDILPMMVNDRQVGIYTDVDFWQCMDTPREYQYLNDLWDADKAPWKIWNQNHNEYEKRILEQQNRSYYRA